MKLPIPEYCLARRQRALSVNCGFFDRSMKVALSVYESFNRRRVCSAERKYFSGTSVSKMSNKVHPFPVLGNSELFGINNTPFCVIPCFP